MTNKDWVHLQLDLRLRHQIDELYADVVRLVESGMTIEKAFESMPVGKYLMLLSGCAFDAPHCN